MISKREQLMETALRHFREKGYHGAGIDAILADTGISKRTLYRYFHSKEELVLSSLRHYDSRSRNGLMRAAEARSKQPIGQILALFDLAGEWFTDSDFRGCLFVKATGEFHPDDSGIVEISRSHKRMIGEYLESLCRKAKLRDPKYLAEELNLLLEGAIAVAQVHGDPNSASIARRVAQRLIAGNSTPKP